MIPTAICELFDIKHPIVQAGMGGFTSAELVAAVTNAGGLGSLGSASRPLDEFTRHLDRIGDLTSGSFAVNYAITVIDEDAFTAGLAAHPKVVTLALDHPRAYVGRAHDAGALVMQQITTVQQAEAAAEQGVDVIIAQGGESGGYGGVVSTMPLVPQVVDAVRPLPVIAAGGITDGRGLAAALMLGALGVNVGTRFLATRESPIVESWKQAIIDAKAQDAVKADVWNDIAPDMGTKGYGTVLRALRTPFLDEWSSKREEARARLPELREQIAAAGAAGTFHDLMIFGGQSAGAITDLPSAGDVVESIVAEAEALLRAAPTFVQE
jgi:nitronate monooxygenase/enoyl-[acyl-carrier protein] reductase II